MDKKILWLASYPKSGNTWLRSIISSLIYTSEGIFNFDLLKLIEQFDKPERYRFVKDINKDDYKKINLKIDCIAKYWIESQKKITINKKINPIYNIFKTHSANLSVNNKNFTNNDVTAGCIYVVRDPREVVISFANHRGASIDKTIDFMSDIGSYFPFNQKTSLTLLSRWDIHYKSWEDLNCPILILRYEDLINNLYKEIQKIIFFLNKTMLIDINNKDKKITNIIKNTNIKKFREFENKFGFQEASKSSKFFGSGRTDSWKKILNKNQISKIETMFKNTMIYFKYL